MDYNFGRLCDNCAFILAANVNQSKRNLYIVYVTYKVYKASLITNKDTLTKTMINPANLQNKY